MTSDEFLEVEHDEAVEQRRRCRRSRSRCPRSCRCCRCATPCCFPRIVAPMAATTERAKRLVDDALASDRLIVTVAARDAEVAEPGARAPVRGRHRRAHPAHDQERRRLAAALGAGPAARRDRRLRADPALPARARDGGRRDARARASSSRRCTATWRASSRSSPRARRPCPSPCARWSRSCSDSSALADVVAANLGLSVGDRQELLEIARRADAARAALRAPRARGGGALARAGDPHAGAGGAHAQPARVRAARAGAGDPAPARRVRDADRAGRGAAPADRGGEGSRRA